MDPSINELGLLIKRRLLQPLPGHSAQMAMAAYQTRLNVIPPATAKAAAVLITIHEGALGLQTTLIQRVSDDKDKHSGQISFPGGKYELVDADLVSCAIREAYEEINLDRSSVEVLGKLSQLYIPVSGFQVTPVVAIVSKEFLVDLVPQPSEVSEILHVPISDILAKETIRSKDMVMQSGIKLINVPYFYLGGKVVWGATAMILNEFISIYREVIQEKR